MKKDNNNRHKVAIGAMLAAGVTTGAIATGACTQVKTTEAQSPRNEVELTAADVVMVDGQEVTIEDVAPLSQDPRRQQAKPMYGVRPNPIRLLYGPRPNPNMRPVQPVPEDVPSAQVEAGVKEVMASMLNVSSRNVKIISKLDEDYHLTAEQRKQLKGELERRFDITIPDDTFKNIKTVGDLVNTICVLKY